MKFGTLIRIGVVLGAVMLAHAAPASAQDAKAVKKLEDMNRAAMEDYDLLDFEAAKAKLQEAIVLLKRTRLDAHAVAARTHMNLGVVYGGGLGDGSTALVEFMSALEIDPELKLDPAYRTPELQKIFDSAKSSLGGGKGVPETGSPSGGRETVGHAAPPEPEEKVVGLKHTTVDEATAGAAIPITVKVGADVSAKQVVLYYRAQGAEQFMSLLLKSQDGVTYSGEIPVAATGGDSLQYYIEARNTAGKIAAGNGNSGSPNIVTLARAAVAEGTAEENDLDEENPLAGEEGEGEGEGEAEGAVQKRARRTGKVVFVNAGLGTGGGMVKGATEKTDVEIECETTCVGLPFAWAPFHVAGEIGIFLSPQVSLSGVFRMGFVFGADVTGHASAAPAGLLRLAYAVSSGGTGLVVHGDVGGGIIRRIVKLKENPNAMDKGTVDTVGTGPLLVGGGASWVHPLGSTLRLVADLNIEVGIPVVKELGTAKVDWGTNADFTLGLGFAL
jgi:hypothetical protein